MSELKIYNPTPRSRLFPNIEREPIVRCTAEWKTIISEAQRKGRENRTAKLSEPRLSLEGDGFILDDDSYATLSQAFIDSSGKFTGFPYKFPLDYYCTATPEYYDTGVYQQGILHPLTTTTFQICKRYSVAGICSYKTLTNIVNGTISIYKDGVLVTSGATVNLTTGVVTFAVAPTGTLTISCEYRFKFRFDVDDLQLTLIRKVVEGYDGGYSAYKAINFKLVEDDYDKVSPLNVVDWTSDIAYDFALKGSPDLTYSERVLSFIEKGDNNKEAREAFTVTRRQFKQESSNRKWKDIQRKYTLFNVAKGRLLTFDFEGVNVRFDQDEFSSEIIGNNAWTFEGLSMIETLYPVGDEVKNFAHCIKIGKKIDNQTYVIPLVDSSGSMDAAIPNVTAAIADLKNILRDTIYLSQSLADKYVKPVTLFGNERYLERMAQDYRDNVSEPAKYLFLVFQNEAGNPDFITPVDYHRTPRELAFEPCAQYLTDFSLFQSAYNSSAIFYCLIFVPTSSPAIDYEVAFNAHVLDAVNGNNGYSSLSSYGIACETYWPINAPGVDIYHRIIGFIG